MHFRLPLPARVVLLACLLLAPTMAATAQQADVLTPERLARLQYVSSAVLSPDGRTIAYTQVVPRDPYEENASARIELHLLDVATGAARPFVTGDVRVSQVAWTADGTGVSYLARHADDAYTTLYVIPADGGAPRAAVRHKGSILAYDWHPDGRRVAYVASEAKAQANGLPYQPEIYEEDYRDRKVWIATAFEDGSTPRMLGLEGSVYDLQWHPTEDRLAVALAPTSLVDDQYMQKRIRVVDARSGDILARIENPGKLGDLAWSPDGRHIAAISGIDINDPKEGRLMVAPASGGPLTDVLPQAALHVSGFAWQDARTLRYLADQGVGAVYGAVQADGTGHRRFFQTDAMDVTAFSTAEGQPAVFVASTPRHPEEVYLLPAGAEALHRLTNSNPWLDDFRLADQEVVTFTARDGLELQGLLIRPLDEQPGRRYPLVLVVHGGPESHYSNGWQTNYSKLGQMAAARGMAVFYPNYRGSTGRGVAFSKTSQGDPAGKEFDDLVDAVDHLIEMGLVDRDKVGVTGGSYGGYATAWLSTRYTDRFAAGVMFVGISNKISKVGTTDIANEEFYVHARKRPWDDWQFFLERSPIYWAEQGRTPLLILHGEDDPRVDVGQSHELYRHLKLHGQAPVRLVLYPGEEHGNRGSTARYDYNLRALRWLEHYLKGPGGEPPPPELTLPHRQAIQATY